jgi:hypothetical protein
MSWRVKFYVWFVVLLGLLPIALYLPQLSLVHISLVFVAAILIFLADIFEVELMPRRSITISEVIYCAVLFIAGPSAMIASVLGGTLPAEIVLRWHRLRQEPSYFFSRVAFNTSQILLSCWAAPLFSKRLAAIRHRYNSPAEIMPLILAYASYTTTNSILVSGILHLTQRIQFSKLVTFIFAISPSRSWPSALSLSCRRRLCPSPLADAPRAHPPRRSPHNPARLYETAPRSPTHHRNYGQDAPTSATPTPPTLRRRSQT